jgi:hypothetical protein
VPGRVKWGAGHWAGERGIRLESRATPHRGAPRVPTKLVGGS